MKKSTTSILLLLSLILITGCSQQTAKPAVEKSTITQDPPINMLEVMKHKTEGDCWVVIRGRVHDVSQDVADLLSVLESCGQDATTLFQTSGGSGQPPSIETTRLLESFYIGDLEIPRE